MAIGVTASLLFLLPIYLASQTVPMLAELTNVDGKAGKASGKSAVLFDAGIGGGRNRDPGVALSQHRSDAIDLRGLRTAGVRRRRDGDRPVSASRSPGWEQAALMMTVSAHALASSGRAISFPSTAPINRFESSKIPPRTAASERALVMGGGRASGIFADNGETSFDYVREAGKALAEVNPARVLVIGAAGFTFPRDAANLASVKQVDAVDVDPVVRRIAETRVSEASHCRPRFDFCRSRRDTPCVSCERTAAHYGFTLVDAYCGKGIPDELVTVEFFTDLRTISDHTAVNVDHGSRAESTFAENSARLISRGVRSGLGEAGQARAIRAYKHSRFRLACRWRDSLEWKRRRLSGRPQHRRPGSREARLGRGRLGRRDDESHP